MESINSIPERSVSTKPMSDESPDNLYSGITGPIFNYTDKPLSINDLDRLSSVKHARDDIYSVIIDGKRYNYDTPKAREYMLKRYKQKFTINPKNFYGFDQGNNTCWFNSTCMALFCNTYGMEYFNYYRKFMVSGKDVHGTKLDPSYSKPLWLLNAMLDTVYRGNRITGDYPTQLVVGLYNALKGSIFEGKPGKGYNSASFIEEILSSIDLNKMRIGYLFGNFRPERSLTMKEYLQKSKIVNQFNILYFRLRYTDNQRLPLTFKNGNAVFKLGSALLYNNLTKQKVGHAIAGIMINNEPYIYDGEVAKLNKPIMKIDWTKIITAREEIIGRDDVEITPKNRSMHTYGGYLTYPIYYRVR